MRNSYILSEGLIVFPDPLVRPARTTLTSEGTKNRSTHVIADPETGGLRLLTPIPKESVVPEKTLPMRELHATYI